MHYQAALRSQGQYKDEVYIVDDGTFRELTVEGPIGLAKTSKPFLHYMVVMMMIYLSSKSR